MNAEHIAYELRKCRRLFIQAKSNIPTKVSMHPITFTEIVIEVFDHRDMSKEEVRKELAKLLTSEDTTLYGMKVIKDNTMPLEYFTLT